MSWTVRNAIEADAQWLVECSARVAEEWKHGDWLLPDDPNYAGVIWLNAIRNHFVIIAEHAGRRRGFLWGNASPHPMNGKPCASTTLWWVVPHARKGRAGLLLLDAFVQWAKRSGIEQISVTVGHKDRAAHYLTRQGFDPEPEYTYMRFPA
jgi:GNAT superfamily N-acetyltransferase